MSTLTSARTGHRACVLDAARDYARIGFARLVSPEYRHLFEGEKGDRLEHVAPHLFACDPHGMIEHLAVAGFPPGEVGILLDTPVSFRELRRHLRRFLAVRRERDRKAVYFRYYDPRVFRVFLPVCTPGELAEFFGPVAAFHCQTEERGGVLTYSLRDGVLHTRRITLGEFFQERYGLPLDVLTQLTAGGMKPEAVQAHA